MSQEQIIQFILERTKTPKDDIFGELTAQNVSRSDFETAWDEAIRRAKAAARQDTISQHEHVSSFRERKLFWVFVGITIGGVVLNAAYAAFISRVNASWLILLVGYVSTFTDSVLGLHLATKLLVIPASLYQNIGFALFAYVVQFLIQGLGFSAIFFTLTSLLVFAFFMMLTRLYEIGPIKAFGVLVIQGVVLFAINWCVPLLYRVFSWIA